MANFTEPEWNQIHDHIDGKEAEYGFPEQRTDSVVLGSFNIRDFGSRHKANGDQKRSDGAWRLLKRMCERFDFLAIQEVEDNIESLAFLVSQLPGNREFVHSDVTGARPEQLGKLSGAERLAFVYRPDKVVRTDLAADISFDRSYLYDTLFFNRDEIWQALDKYQPRFDRFIEKKKQGKKTKKPLLKLPQFLSFIRQPHVASFEVPSADGAAPYEFAAVNAHLLYAGGNKTERKAEFNALMDWLLDRAKKTATLPVKNTILFGDLNLDFTKPKTQRPKIEKRLKEFNEKDLPRDTPAEFNFPFFDPHPATKKVFRVNARLTETYDQIAIIRHDRRLPGPSTNASAGTVPGGFDYGVVNFVRLFEDVILDGKSLHRLSKTKKESFVGKYDRDVSDHMPIWIRLPIPTVGQLDL